MDKVEKIINDIKKLKIQGARNVAKAALTALALQIKSSKAENLDQLYNEILHVADKLANSRPTEPMMRNNIDDVTRFALLQIKMKNIRTVGSVKKLLVEREEELLKEMDKNIAKIAEYGAKMIPDNAVVITHCHSSSVTRIFKRAKEMGKKFEVIACETRPLYQGRITAHELVEAKIKTTLIVDGAVNVFMKKADMCIVGADAITSRGDLINKVGTGTVAHIARMHDVSFYSAAELFKYSPLTAFGQRERIEERAIKEVWDKPPKGLTIRNPSFDATAAHYITGYITEAGIIPATSLFAIATQKLGIK